MILSGRQIRAELGKKITITPFDEAQLNPNSYNLRLADELMVYTDETLDMRVKPQVEHIKIPAAGLVLQPSRLYLGRTVEYTETHGLVPLLEGRSSIGRLGVAVHLTAGFGDNGFCGYWTLEIYCVQAIRIYAGTPVCQIFYHTTDPDSDQYTSSKYQNNKGIQESLLYTEFSGKPE